MRETLENEICSPVFNCEGREDVDLLALTPVVLWGLLLQNSIHVYMYMDVVCSQLSLMILYQRH